MLELKQKLFILGWTVFAQKIVKLDLTKLKKAP